MLTGNELHNSTLWLYCLGTSKLEVTLVFQFIHIISTGIMSVSRSRLIGRRGTIIKNTINLQISTSLQFVPYQVLLSILWAKEPLFSDTKLERSGLDWVETCHIKAPLISCENLRHPVTVPRLSVGALHLKLSTACHMPIWLGTLRGRGAHSGACSMDRLSTNPGYTTWSHPWS